LRFQQRGSRYRCAVSKETPGNRGPIALSVEGLSKSFPGVQALDDVSVQILEGAIHGLCGKNGAGKSTLVSAIAGLVRVDAGRILYYGEDITRLSVSAVKHRGIRIVSQHAAMVPDMSIAENLLLGEWPSRGGILKRRNLVDAAQEEFAQYGMKLDVTLKAKNLGLIEQRKVEIVRALFGGSRLVILDEPLTMLDNSEKKILFHFVRGLAERNISVIYTSHNVSELLELCDNITILRAGRTVGTYPSSILDEATLTRHIVGDTKFIFRRNRSKDRQPKQVVAQITNLVAPGVKDVSIDLYGGEVVSLVDRMGGGGREFARTLAGLNQMRSGSVKVGSHHPATLRRPSDALRRGIAMLTHDRHGEGLILGLSVERNIPLSNLMIIARSGIVRRGAERNLARTFISRLDIRTPGPSTLVSSLSGGNQQKVYLSKFLVVKPRLLILDEPTSGVDITGKEDLLASIDELRQEGFCILYHSNELDEALRIADRLAIFSAGRLYRTVDNDHLTEDRIFQFLRAADKEAPEGMEETSEITDQTR